MTIEAEAWTQLEASPVSAQIAHDLRRGVIVKWRYGERNAQVSFFAEQRETPVEGAGTRIDFEVKGSQTGEAPWVSVGAIEP